MMVNNEKQSSAADVNVEDLLLALITLEVDKRERALDVNQVKTELLLAGAGLGYQQIAKIMGKNSAAVRMTISRSKTKADPKKTQKAGE